MADEAPVQPAGGEASATVLGRSIARRLNPDRQRAARLQRGVGRLVGAASGFGMRVGRPTSVRRAIESTDHAAAVSSTGGLAVEPPVPTPLAAWWRFAHAAAPAPAPPPAAGRPTRAQRRPNVPPRGLPRVITSGGRSRMGLGTGPGEAAERLAPAAITPRRDPAVAAVGQVLTTREARWNDTTPRVPPGPPPTPLRRSPATAPRPGAPGQSSPAPGSRAPGSSTPGAPTPGTPAQARAVPGAPLAGLRTPGAGAGLAMPTPATARPAPGDGAGPRAAQNPPFARAATAPPAPPLAHAPAGRSRAGGSSVAVATPPPVGARGARLRAVGQRSLGRLTNPPAHSESPAASAAVRRAPISPLSASPVPAAPLRTPGAVSGPRRQTGAPAAAGVLAHAPAPAPAPVAAPGGASPAPGPQSAPRAREREAPDGVAVLTLAPPADTMAEVGTSAPAAERAPAHDRAHAPISTHLAAQAHQRAGRMSARRSPLRAAAAPVAHALTSARDGMSASARMTDLGLAARWQLAPSADAAAFGAAVGRRALPAPPPAAGNLTGARAAVGESTSRHAALPSALRRSTAGAATTSPPPPPAPALLDRRERVAGRTPPATTRGNAQASPASPGWATAPAAQSPAPGAPPQARRSPDAARPSDDARRSMSADLGTDRGASDSAALSPPGATPADVPAGSAALRASERSASSSGTRHGGTPAVSAEFRPAGRKLAPAGWSVLQPRDLIRRLFSPAAGALEGGLPAATGGLVSALSAGVLARTGTDAFMARAASAPVAGWSTRSGRTGEPASRGAVSPGSPARADAARLARTPAVSPARTNSASPAQPAAGGVAVTQARTAGVVPNPMAAPAPSAGGAPAPPGSPARVRRRIGGGTRAGEAPGRAWRAAAGSSRPASVRRTHGAAPTGQSPASAWEGGVPGAAARGGHHRFVPGAGPSPAVPAPPLRGVPMRPVARRFLEALSSRQADAPTRVPAHLQRLAGTIAGAPVEVRSGPTSRAALAAVGKKAATVGRVVHLAAPPDRSPAAAEVLAHEMVHAAHPSPAPRFYADLPSREEHIANEVGALARSLVATDAPIRRITPDLPLGAAQFPVASSFAAGAGAATPLRRSTGAAPAAATPSSAAHRGSAAASGTRRAASGAPAAAGVSPELLRRFSDASRSRGGRSMAMSPTSNEWVARSPLDSLSDELGAFEGGPLPDPSEGPRSGPNDPVRALEEALAHPDTTPWRMHPGSGARFDGDAPTPVPSPPLLQRPVDPLPPETLDWIIEKVEQRVVEELERRGLRYNPGVF